MAVLYADIPLLPAIGSPHSNLNFVVHWLNNKELHFTLESEKILEEMTQRGGSGESGPSGDDSGTDPSEAPTETEGEETGDTTVAMPHPVAGMPSEPVMKGQAEQAVLI